MAKSDAMPSPSKLRDAYELDLANAWALSRSKHPDHAPYAFVLYGVEGGQPPKLWPCVLAEESLTTVAQSYLTKGYYDTLDEARSGLRYSVADSPFVHEMVNCVPTVDALTAPYGKTLDDDTGYALLAKAAIDAMRKLDAQGIFAKGAERERLLLLIIIEGTPTERSQEFARKLNPPSVYARFEAATKIEGTFASSGAIAIASDGRSLYSAGSRTIPVAKPGDLDSLEGLVAYDIRGKKLVRRCAFEFPGFGDSIREVVSVPNDRSVLALRRKYVNNIGQTILMRFSPDSNVAIQEHSLVGEPAGFALSADGSRIAVALHTKTLHVFDANFNPLSSRTFDVKIFHPRFLRSGVLLIPTDSGLLCLDVERNVPPTVAWPHPAFRHAADFRETLLAIVPRSLPSVLEKKVPEASGVHIMSLPSFEAVRIILVPGHRATMPAFSPDGRMLAFNAHDLNTPREFIVVFDAATGEEIIRRKSNFVNALAFLPDNQTLVVAKSGITTTEPIDFWNVLGG